MFVFLEWKSQFHKMFYTSYAAINDYGKCCFIIPQFDFDPYLEKHKGKFISAI